MDFNDKTLKIGAGVICAAIVLRLAAGGFFRPVVEFFLRPETAYLLLYLETGRVTRLYREPETTEAWSRESPAPEVSPESEPLTLNAQELELVSLSATRDVPELSPLLEQPLNWELTGTEPAVLILHTHATESYTKAPGEDYAETSDYRTVDPAYNMLSVGDALAEQLAAGGISVLHDRTLHDGLSYNGSYAAARETVAAYLEKYPSIRLILDLHRDAADTPQGQLVTAAVADGEETAQLMIVVGSDGTGMEHPNWQENLALALKLHIALERENPGICRDLCLRGSRYNQDMLPGMLLIEVGAAGDTRDKALRAAEVLGRGILSMAHGVTVTTEMSTSEASGLLP